MDLFTKHNHVEGPNGRTDKPNHKEEDRKLKKSKPTTD